MVGRSFSSYERELRTLLEGDPSAVRSYARVLPAVSRPEFERVIHEPFLVIRGAGSLGFDLVAMRWSLSFPIEVKASSEPVIHFSSASGRANAQLAAHRAAIEKVGLSIVYAFRRIGLRSAEPWRVYRGNDVSSRGVLGLVCRSLPPVGSTRDGNAVLRWEEGQDLSRFLARTRELLGPSRGAGS